MTTALAKPVRFPITEEEARARLSERKRQARGLSYAWFDFCAALRKDFSDRVPERLGLTARKYVESIIPHERSRADIYMTIRIAERLPSVSPEDLKEIGRRNAYALTQLPKITEEWLQKAKNMGESAFRAEVEADKAKREGALYDPQIYIAEAFRLNKLPKSLADAIGIVLRHICSTEKLDYESREGRLQALEALIGEYMSANAPESL